MQSKIYSYCIYLLSKQDYSEFKMRQKLRQKRDFLPHEIDETIASLKAKGYLREDAYRRLFIRKWMQKGESEQKIRQRGAMEKLQFEPEEFSTVEEELGFNEDDSIEKLVEKKLRSKEIPSDSKERGKLRDKVLRFLISKGHGYDEAKKALSKRFNSASAADSELF